MGTAPLVHLWAGLFRRCHRREVQLTHSRPIRPAISGPGYSEADRLCQRDCRGYHRAGADIPRRMPLPRRILDQPCVTRPEAPRRAIAETDFQLARDHDYVLTPWRRMPIQKSSGRLLIKYNMRGRLRLA